MSDSSQRKKYVRYYEPWTEDPIDVLVEEAIAQQKATVKYLRPSFKYENDQDALDDFVIVHWGEIIEK